MIPSDIGLPPHFKFFRSEVKQEETILSLATSSNRSSLVSAPPGSGKTLMAVSPSIINGWRVLYLTATKPQSQQVYNDFSSIGMVDIKGHVNYECASSGYFSDLDSDFECSSNTDGTVCYYREKIDQCLRSNLVSTNYAHWISILKSDDPGRLGNFDVIILDEAHKAPDILGDHMSVVVQPRHISEYLECECLNESDSIYLWQTWAKEIIGKIRFILSRKRIHDDIPLSRKASIILTRIERDLTRFYLDRDSEWVVESDFKTKSITLSPVWPMNFAERYLFNGIPRIICISATINPTTAKYLGIPSDSMDYIEVDSSFPRNRRPFIYVPTTLVDYKMSDAQKQLLVSQFDRFIEGRLDRKGVIHCISYDKGHDIFKLSKFRDSGLFILDTKYENTQDVLSQFVESDSAKVLISPAIEEGIDLPGDLCRYQIIYKMPMIDGRGKIPQARIKQDRGYKLYIMSQRLEQMYGRSTRSKEDWSETAIFDDYFYRLKRQVSWHRWFEESWVKYTGVPRALMF